ncbi:MAG: hypothetical protein WBP64_01040 [Nitrososphaeraceae archaeon]
MLCILLEEPSQAISNNNLLPQILCLLTNVWGEPKGPDKAITQGWWLMLKPLPPG